jgi:hypothetical protein
MRKISLIILIIFSAINLLFSQNVKDSLVLFTDLKYHSEFEKNALYNFVKQKRDTFNLFLAIDENMTSEEAIDDYNTYIKVFDEMNQEKIASKKIQKQIKIAYSSVHSRFLKKYNSNEFYPVMLRVGTYNCVSASMLYSLVFDKLKIPYKVMASSDHVYLIANPGENSVVIETTNPSFEKIIFNGEFKQQYVDYLRDSKLISDADYKSKSVEEIFEEKFNEVKNAEFWNLPGFQYYNKAVSKMQNNEIEKSYELCQKAYFFYPDQQVKTVLYTALLILIEKSNFDKVSDIDYLAQFSRFENSDLNLIIGIFNNIIGHYLQYTDKDQYCDSLFKRLTSQITNKVIKEEVSFSYFMQMSYRYQNINKVEYYVNNALKIKGNHHDANVILTNYIQNKLNDIDDSYSKVDTIKQFEKKYNYEQILPMLKEQEMIVYLRIAADSYNHNQIKTGDKYLELFENNCKLPIENRLLNFSIESTYHTIAVYHYNKHDKIKAKSIVDKGLKYIPDSKLIKAAIY